jgi:hypothetical protein
MGALLLATVGVGVLSSDQAPAPDGPRVTSMPIAERLPLDPSVGLMGLSSRSEVAEIPPGAYWIPTGTCGSGLTSRRDGGRALLAR